MLMASVQIVFAQGKLISANSSYFIDSALVGADGIVKEKFVPQKSDYYIFENSFPVWIKVSLPPDEQVSVVQFSSSMLDSVSLYRGNVVHQGELVQYQEGAYNSIIPLFEIPAHRDSIDLLFRVRDRELVIFSIENGTYRNTFGAINKRAMIMSGFCILILFVLVLNIVVYIMVRARLSLYFTLFSFFTFSLIFITSGIVKYIFPDLFFYSGSLIVPISGGLIISGIFMSVNILRIRRLLPLMYKVLMGAAVFVFGLILLYAAGEKAISSMIINLVGGLLIPTYIYASWRAFRNGQPYAISYMIGWILYYAVILVLLLLIYRVIPPGPNVIYLTPCISLIDFLFITITILGKVSHYRREKERSDTAYLELVNNQNIILEEKVQERTRKQEELNNEIAVQNEELQQQKEQIILLNESLEKMVEERTSELSYALINLEKRNVDLENFSHVVSHNLRGPVASILGLMEVYEQKRPGNPSDEDLVRYMKTTVTGLDKVIRDLNQILTIKHAATEERVEVSLQDVMDITLSLLSSQIIESKATVEYSFAEASIVSIPAYIQNIFYNLISNSIKYSKCGVPPCIYVTTEQNEDSIRFIFKDEGIGIDIRQEQRDMIFKMYYRVNNSTEGKGIGLYLVKCQVETLGGTIEVQTARGKGTAFIIDLPVSGSK